MTETQETGLMGELETPFAESLPLAEDRPPALGFLPWTEAPSPFSEILGSELEDESESAELIAEVFEDLRDESFDEALAELIAETSRAADQRTQGEQPMQLADQRFQLADAHLQPIGFEAERCVQRLAEQLENLDLEGLAPGQLDELLARFDPGPATVTPAGEEFIGGLIKKAKSVVKSVVKVAGKVAKAALGPILNKLKALVRPLLRRVLAIAINKLPAALHEPARALARRFGLGDAKVDAAQDPTGSELELEAEDEQLSVGFAGSRVLTLDPETLAESFDAALAESVLGGGELEQGESFGHDRERGGEPESGHQLERLAEARSAFMAQLQAAADNEDMGPAVDRFIPAILPALHLGLRLVGRPKVVNFLAGFVAKLIGKWVGPTMSAPLSQAIVDIGLRIVGLEHTQPGTLEAEAAPAALAATVEDTVRRLSEQPEHVLEDEGLLQVAVTEAFEQAAAANFPAPLVRPDLRLAPSLGGTFVTCHPRQPYAYKKLTRVPEVELNVAQASAMRSFRGVTVDAALRANGLTLPAKFRVHVFEAGPGTTLPRLAQLERILGPSGQRGAYRLLHPLTVANATALLREPKLGVDVPDRFLQSRHKISVGQRFFHLEPVGQTAVAAPVPTREGPSCDATQPSEARIQTSPGRGPARVTIFFSEVDAQKLAASVTAAPGGAALLRAVLAIMRTARSTPLRDDAVPAAQEPESEGVLESERRAGRRRPPRRRPPGRRTRLRSRIRAGAARALSQWARTRGTEFVTAAQDPACGVTITVELRGMGGAAAAAETVGATPAADAATTVTVTPGRPATPGRAAP